MVGAKKEKKSLIIYEIVVLGARGESGLNWDCVLPSRRAQIVCQLCEPLAWAAAREAPRLVCKGELGKLARQKRQR